MVSKVKGGYRNYLFGPRPSRHAIDVEIFLRFSVFHRLAILLSFLFFLSVCVNFTAKFGR